MRVAVLPSDTGACGTYRMIWPSQAVKRVRPDWDITLYSPQSVAFYTEPKTKRLHHVNGLPPLEDLDLLVMHRVGSPAVVELMQYAQARGCAVLLDNDDAMWAIDRQNSAWPAWNNPRGFHWRTTDAAARQADLCSNTTPALAKRYGAGRSELVPNYLPERALDCAPPAYDNARVPVVGWSGQLATHPRDPSVVGDAVAQVVASGAAVQVAAQPEAVRLRRIWGVDDIVQVPPAPLGEEYFTSLRAFDVALVPLEANPFNRAKSALKALECAAAGCAVVASPTPANRSLAGELPILLASTPAQWREHVERLLSDPAERRERGQQARAAIRAGWTFETQGERWAAVWERAINRRVRLRQLVRA